jgi:hypothetical protein
LFESGFETFVSGEYTLADVRSDISRRGPRGVKRQQERTLDDLTRILAFESRLPVRWDSS